MISNAQDIIVQLKKILANEAVFVLVFGSILNRAFNEESDVDIGIFLPENSTTEDKSRLRLALVKAIDRDVDVVILNDADLIITLQILANGQLIINNSPKTFIEFKALKISEYIDFKISRRFLEYNLVRGMARA
jgi:predicted nucleotidyltransferase